MKTTLNFSDIQGNVVRAYGRFGFPYARYVFFSVHEGAHGRRFVAELIPMVTTSAPWESAHGKGDGAPKPEAAVNLAFTYHGLKKLELPEVSLHSFSETFTQGMQARRDILGDDGPSAPERWDPVWRNPDERTGIFVGINAVSRIALERAYGRVLEALHRAGSGVRQIAGHRGPNGAEDLPYQDAAALFENGTPGPKEHFGYTDGISNPVFEGGRDGALYAFGNGKPTGADPATLEGWAPLAAGEFVLGYRDEAGELPTTAPIPHLLAKNGSYLVYRKLHENVASFDSYLRDEAKRAKAAGAGGADEIIDEEWVAAKFAGRWRNGAPLTLFPRRSDAEDYMNRVNAARAAMRAAKGTVGHAAAEAAYLELAMKLVGFDYVDDLDGARCPLGAHVRRANPRSALEFGQTGAFNTPGALSDRRRILRRGLPYGDSTTRDDAGDHGIIFMAVCADVKRQFEFVQQQWFNYGNDFKLANEKDALLGNHGKTSDGRGTGTMAFQTRKGEGKCPHLCSGIPRFVETRGGEYFFVPSVTALKMIALGAVDPT